MQVDVYCSNLRKHTNDDDVARGYGLHTYTYAYNQLETEECGELIFLRGLSVERIAFDLFKCRDLPYVYHRGDVALYKYDSDKYWTLGIKSP